MLYAVSKLLFKKINAMPSIKVTFQRKKTLYAISKFNFEKTKRYTVYQSYFSKYLCPALILGLGLLKSQVEQPWYCFLIIMQNARFWIHSFLNQFWENISRDIAFFEILCKISTKKVVLMGKIGILSQAIVTESNNKVVQQFLINFLSGNLHEILRMLPC